MPHHCPTILHLDQGPTLVPLCHPWHPKLFPCLFLSGKEGWVQPQGRGEICLDGLSFLPTQKEVSGRLGEEIAKGAGWGRGWGHLGKARKRGGQIRQQGGLSTAGSWRDTDSLEKQPACLPGSGRPPPLSPQIRLSGGRSRFEGRVEVAMAARGNRARQWGLICGEGWGTLEAMVACRQLGLGFANHGLQVGHCCQGLAWLLGGRPGTSSWGVPHAGWCTLGEEFTYGPKPCHKCGSHIPGQQQLA